MTGDIARKDFSHYPVLYNEVMKYIQPINGGKYVDGTLGGGGHAAGILHISSPEGVLLGLDIDNAALDIARVNLAEFGDRAILKNGSFLSMQEHINSLGWESVDGILLDLGVSSIQLDTPERGFSFRHQAPLDMRFDTKNPVTAYNIVNNLSQKELTELLINYGDERYAHSIAKHIIKSRPVETTYQLAEIVTKVYGRFRRSIHKKNQKKMERIHPATRTFQAVRIAVNREIEVLEEVLPQIVNILAIGAVAVIISFHSIEDRIVKRFYKRESKDCICLPRQPICTCGHTAKLRVLTKAPVRPKEEEIISNVRARSARLRAAKRI